MRIESKTLELTDARAGNAPNAQLEVGSEYTSKTKALQQAEAYIASAQLSHPMTDSLNPSSVLAYYNKSRSEITKRDPGSWRAPTNYTFRLSQQGVGPYLMDMNTKLVASTNRRYVNGTWYYRGVVNVYSRNRRCLALPYAQHADIPSAMYRVRNKAMQTVKSNGFNAAMALIESRQSAALVGEYIRRIGGIVKAVRKKDPNVLRKSFRVLRDDKRYTKKSSDLWLETMYGLRPLLSDAHSTVQLMQDNIKKYDQYVVARSTLRQEGTLYSETPERMTGDGVSPFWLYPKVKWKHSTTLDEKVVLWFKVSDPRLVLAKEIGFTNPAVLAWDAIPLFSLLTDWVLPIGQYLDLLDYDLGLSFMGGAETTFVRSTAKAVSIRPDGNQGALHIGSPQRIPINISFDRRALTSPPQPQLPRIRNPFSVERAVSSVALLRQRLK